MFSLDFFEKILYRTDSLLSILGSYTTVFE